MLALHLRPRAGSACVLRRMAPRGLSLAVAGAGGAAMHAAFVAPAAPLEAQGLRAQVAPVTAKAVRSKGGLGTVVASGGALALLMRRARPWPLDLTKMGFAGAAVVWQRAKAGRVPPVGRWHRPKGI